MGTPQQGRENNQTVAAAADAHAGRHCGPGGAVASVVNKPRGIRTTTGVDPLREDAYWREHFSQRAYVEEGSSYDDYGPAYGFGVAAFGQNPGRTFESAEPELARQWNAKNGASMLSWEDAMYAVRDAWNRLSRSANPPR